MNMQELLLSKNGIAAVAMAQILLGVPVGEKIPTILELANKTSLANGTVHHGLKTLADVEAVKIVSRGHMGSYLVEKDYKKLLEILGIKYLLGAMPLPYTKRYEGLASGLISSMENGYNIPVNLSYMRGSKNRISMVAYERYDFAITSKLAAKEYMKKHDDIKILLSFGPMSYVANHAIMFFDVNCKEIKDGMKVGVDRSSIDQISLTKQVCDGKKVKYIELESSHIIEHVIKGDIDAMIMNLEEVGDCHLKVNCVPIKDENPDNTEAVLVVKNNGNDTRNDLLEKMIDPNIVLNIQKQVLEGKIESSY